jgi:hypothetical protein
MGDRLPGRGRRTGRGLSFEPSPPRGKPPSPLAAWGLSSPQMSSPQVGLGHNGGPPIDQPENDAYIHWKWRQAHKEVWKNPSPAVARLRVARAEAAGVDYRTYMLVLLDTGKFLQRNDAVLMGLARPSDDVRATQDAREIISTWRNTIARVTPRANQARVATLGDALLAAYSGPEPQCVSIAQIAKLLRNADAHSPLARSPSVTLTLLLHGTLPKSIDRSEALDSATLAERWLIELGARTAFIDDVIQLIRATREELPNEDLSAEARVLRSLLALT